MSQGSRRSGSGGRLAEAGDGGEVVGGGVAALDESLLKEQDVHDHGIEIFDGDAFGAGDEGFLKLAGPAENVGGEGKFFGKLITEGL